MDRLASLVPVALSLALLGCLEAEPDDVGEQSEAITAGCLPLGEPPVTSGCGSLHERRKQLFQQYADAHNMSAEQAWASLGEVGRAVFNMTTDLLGQRTVLADGSTALDRVTRILTIVGNECESQGKKVDCQCGGDMRHRIVFEADAQLIGALRGRQVGQWENSQDLGGVHAPFSDTSETKIRLGAPLLLFFGGNAPGGQVQFWKTDSGTGSPQVKSDAQLARLVSLGVPQADKRNPHLVELDVDFAAAGHPSNPLCGNNFQKYADKFNGAECGDKPNLNWKPPSGTSDGYEWSGGCECDSTQCGCAWENICTCQGACAADECHDHSAGCGVTDECGHAVGSSADCGCPGEDPCACRGECECTPVTSCAAQGRNCGWIHDGCQWVDCGTCVGANTCGGGGAAGVCGCTPTTCAAQGATCGFIDDGCNGTLYCGGCDAPYTCNGQHQCECVAVVLNPPSCGWYQDSCGNWNDAGGCADGWTCNSGTCTQVCTALVPSCGWYQDSCGTWFYAGDCGPCGDNNWDCYDDCTGSYTCYACGDWNYDCYDDCTWEYTCANTCDGVVSNENGWWYSCWDWQWYCEYYGGWYYDPYGCYEASQCCWGFGY